MNVSSWSAQDAVLIELWRKAEGIDYIMLRLAAIGPKRTSAAIYQRVGALRAQGVGLAKRPKGGRWAANSHFAGRTETLEEVTTRIDEDGRVITVCPPRWCAGARRTWWGG